MTAALQVAMQEAMDVQEAMEMQKPFSAKEYMEELPGVSGFGGSFSYWDPLSKPTSRNPP